MLLPDPSEIVRDRADRQAPDEGEVGAEQDESVGLGGQATEVEVPAEGGKELALAGPVPVSSS